MKFALSTKLLTRFRKEGRIQISKENIPFLEIEKEIKNASEERDLWNNSPFLKKWILQILGPLALELANESSLRLGADQKVNHSLEGLCAKDILCIQGLSVVFVLTQEGDLEVLEPTSLFPKNSLFFIAFTKKDALLIDNPKDPYRVKVRSKGYVYGDRLKDPFHPLIFQKSSFL